MVLEYPSFAGNIKPCVLPKKEKRTAKAVLFLRQFVTDYKLDALPDYSE
jgi:hypothetical protein